MNREERRAIAKGRPVKIRQTVPASFKHDRPQPKRLGTDARKVRVDP